MGRLSPSDTPVFDRIAANSTLRFGYCEAGPGRRSADNENSHCLVVLAQPEPIRVLTTRDGETRRDTLGPGHLALAPQGSDTVWEWLDPARVVLIWLDPHSLRRFVEIDMRLLINPEALQNEVVIEDPALAASARRLHDAARHSDVGEDILFDALARVFLVTMMRHYGLRDEAAQPVVETFGVAGYSQLVIHIETRLGQKITPASLAEVVGMSEASFGRKFKEQTGHTPMAFVKLIRLRRAKAMLEQHRVTLSEIAIRCGFADQAHFSRVFRAAYGLAPGQYRARLRGR